MDPKQFPHVDPKEFPLIYAVVQRKRAQDEHAGPTLVPDPPPVLGHQWAWVVSFNLIMMLLFSILLVIHLYTDHN